ncbi:alpha/beta hydrolase [Paenibacillus sp. VCA1]|uniref:alpha/beta hydrolase n=1 Tax=Paenibacillus sp. VCA1 TaxID=3039148 RepID=UPI0028727723|nr:alpha/beta hydrolase [Paenibacillus sp. VCA1]MDR9856299.1 alpha/beta hydrolase [Paenibacillus sp. VCA1]
MLHIRHHLEGAAETQTSPGSSLLLYPVEEASGLELPFMLVLPGGGYQHLAQHEGEAIAKWFNALGMHAGVLHYQLEPINPASLIRDVAEAIDWARNTAKPFRVTPDKIGMIGFSAGGHLASITATTASSKPDLLILSYPVITFEEPYTHQGSRQRFLGADPAPETVQRNSSDTRVTADTPPTFLWTTANDAAVPVENSLRFAAALSKAGVPFELHVFEDGRHGLGLAEDHPLCRQWVECCQKWLQRHHFVKGDEPNGA